MSVNKYNYTKFNKISTSKLKEYNIYGIIVEVNYKLSYDRNGESQDEYRIKINDGTQDEDINVTAFCAVNHIPSDVFQRGKIVRFHRLSKKFFKNNADQFYLYGRIGGMISVLLFDIPTSDEKIKFAPSYRSSSNYTHSAKDEKLLTDLISKAKEILDKSETTPKKDDATTEAAKSNTSVQNASAVTSTRFTPWTVRLSSTAEPAAVSTTSIAYQTEQQPLASASTVLPQLLQQNPARSSAPKAPTDKDRFNKMYQLVCGNRKYYNVLFQIVSCYKNVSGNIILRVCDGTQNSKQLFVSPSNEMKLIYGDEERERLIEAKKKLYDVVCYDNHGEMASNCKAGDYIALMNVHFYIPNNCTHPSLVMHSGSGSIKSAKGISDAGRRIVKITEGMPHFDVIDGLIKEHETKLSEDKSLQPPPSNAVENDWNDSFDDDSFLDEFGLGKLVTVAPANIQPPNNNSEAVVMMEEVPSLTVETNLLNNDDAVTVAPSNIDNNNAVITVAAEEIPSNTQCSTITLSSDDSAQSCIILSQYSPKKNVDMNENNTTNVQNSTVSSFPSTSSATRRTATVAFPETQNSDPPPKRLCLRDLTNVQEAVEECGSTQELFDRLKTKKSQAEDYPEESFISEEVEMLNAITAWPFFGIFLWGSVFNGPLFGDFVFGDPFIGGFYMGTTFMGINLVGTFI